MSTEQIGRHRALPQAETSRRFMIERIPAKMIAIGAIATSAFIPVTTGHNKAPGNDTGASLIVESDVSQLVEPGMTITVPDLLKKGPAKDYNMVAPMYEDDPGYCEAVTIPLESGVSQHDLEVAATIEMALPFDSYKKLKDEVGYNLIDISAQSVQRVMKKALAPLGIEAVFADNYYSEKYTVQKLVGTDSERTQNYASGILNHLYALAHIPKAMLDNVKTIQFIDGTMIDKETKEGVAGLATNDNVPGRTDTIVLKAGGDSESAFVHEVAHTLHAEACRGSWNDTEMKMAYAQALGLLEALPERSVLQDQLTRNLKDKELLGVVRQLDTQRDIAGFPSNYALESKEYGELFADLTQDLFLDQEHSVLAGESREAKALRQLVIERLQKAMPDIDVSAYVAARTYYRHNMSLPTTPLEKVVKDKVSQYDDSYSMYWRGVEDGTYSAKPAMVLRSADGHDEQYIYAYFENGDASALTDSGLDREIGLAFPADIQVELREEIVQKAATYLQRYVQEGERVRINRAPTLGSRGQSSHVIVDIAKDDKNSPTN